MGLHPVAPAERLAMIQSNRRTPSRSAHREPEESSTYGGSPVHVVPHGGATELLLGAGHP
eukprot:6699999-Alexandrium_andersonii.AAC.1